MTNKNQNIQLSLLNLRQMYEGVVQEKVQLQQELASLRAIVCGLIYPEETAFIQPEALQALESGLIEGISVDGPHQDGTLSVTLVMGDFDAEEDEG